MTSTCATNSVLYLQVGRGDSSTDTASEGELDTSVPHSPKRTRRKLKVPSGRLLDKKQETLAGHLDLPEDVLIEEVITGNLVTDSLAMINYCNKTNQSLSGKSPEGESSEGTTSGTTSVDLDTKTEATRDSHGNPAVPSLPDSSEPSTPTAAAPGKSKLLSETSGNELNTDALVRNDQKSPDQCKAGPPLDRETTDRIPEKFMERIGTLFTAGTVHHVRKICFSFVQTNDLSLRLLESSYFSIFHSESSSPIKSPTEAVVKAMGLVTKENPPDAQVN